MRLTLNANRLSARVENFILKNRYYMLLTFAILLPLAAVAAGTVPVYGQSCGLQVGSMVASTQNSGSYSYGTYNVQLTVPMTMSCGNAGPQVWATGTAYDTVTNSNLGTNYAIMSGNNGYYSGQLVFNLPSSIVEHQLQVQIQVYNSYNNGQYSGLIATSSPTVTVHGNSPYYSSPQNSYYNGYQTGCYNGYYYYSYGGYPSYYYGYPNYYSCSYSYSYPYYYYYYGYPYYYYGYYSYGYHYWHHH